MQQIGILLDESITGLKIRDSGPPPIDLSKINFEALAKRFKESKHKNTDLEALKAAIAAKLEKLVRLNRTRADFAEKIRGTDRELQQWQPEHRAALRGVAEAVQQP